MLKIEADVPMNDCRFCDQCLLANHKFQCLDHPKFVIFVVWSIFKVVKAKVVVVLLLLLMLMMSQFWVCLVKSFYNRKLLYN